MVCAIGLWDIGTERCGHLASVDDDVGGNEEVRMNVLVMSGQEIP